MPRSPQCFHLLLNCWILFSVDFLHFLSPVHQKTKTITQRRMAWLNWSYPGGLPLFFQIDSICSSLLIHTGELVSDGGVGPTMPRRYTWKPLLESEWPENLTRGSTRPDLRCGEFMPLAVRKVNWNEQYCSVQIGDQLKTWTKAME